ncbi:uncharacterized protein TNCV_5051861 [Trichonephila clavipes]|nr:uncharacterized protein TNCV_5051861 [Trichonephila clavipes]
MVTYRPQANLTERVNRNLVQMIACFAEENHDNWDRFLHEFFRAQQLMKRQGTAGLEDLRLKHKNVGSNGTAERNNRKRSKIGRKRSFQGPEHRDQKRYTPVLPQGLQRTVPSFVASRIHKYRRKNFNPSQGPESISGPSHQQQMRQLSPPTEDSRRGERVQSEKAQETRTTSSKGHSAAEERPVRSGKTTTVRPCPYYFRSRLKEPEGIPKEQRSTGIDSLPQNRLRRRNLSMEALDGDPADRSTLDDKEKKSGCMVLFSFSC